MVEVERAVAISSSAQDMRELRHMEAFIAFAQGRLRESRQLALQAVELFPDSAGAVQARILAGWAAALLGDAEGLATDLAWLGERSTTTWVDREGTTLDAAALALAGRTDEATQLYRRVIDHWRVDELWMDLGLALLTRAVLLGPADREAAESLEEARRIFAAMGAEGLVDRLTAAAVKPGAVRREPLTQSEDVAQATR
jgi:hypothetical protein